MKNTRLHSGIWLSPREAARGWLAKHAIVDMWLNRATIWVVFAVIAVSRR